MTDTTRGTTDAWAAERAYLLLSQMGALVRQIVTINQRPPTRDAVAQVRSLAEEWRAIADEVHGLLRPDRMG